MKKFLAFAFQALAWSTTLLSAGAFAQLTTSPPATVAGRVDALNAIYSSYWEDQLKHNPEFASSLGDKRYDDQLSDFP